MSCMKSKIIPPEAPYQIRCPKLGHLISFSYCRAENLGSPCFKTLDCWFEHFPVRAFFMKELSAEEFRKCFETPPKQKLTSILEIIEKFNKEER